MSVDLESQKALRARFTTTAAILALVPASNILDSNQRPAPVPSIILGESQTAEPYHCADLRVSSIRTLRDPDGEHSHGIVTVEALIVEGMA